MKKLLFAFVIFVLSCDNDPLNIDVLIKGGTIHDGSGMNGYVGNVAIKNDTIFYVGKKGNFIANKTIDASGKIVSPGFINMLSWGYSTLMQDGRSLSDLKQGVTLEVFGEGTSPGPYGSVENNNYVSFGEAMEKLEASGISTNIASYLGATTVRIQEIGYANRKATSDEMESMRNIVKLAMMQGAMPMNEMQQQELMDAAKTKCPADYKKATEDGITMDVRQSVALNDTIPINEAAYARAGIKVNWNIIKSGYYSTVMNPAKQKIIRSS